MSKTGAILQLMAKGGPFKVVDAPVPSPQADEIVFRLKTIALNALEWKQMMSGMMLPGFPAVLGLEASGVVDAVGSDVNHVKSGDAIIARCSPGGRAASYQEYAAVQKSNVALKPKDLTFEEAGSLPIGFYTATTIIHEGLGISLPFIDAGRVQNSELKRLLVIGGSSAVGTAAIQLLRLGLPDSVIVTTCSQRYFEKAVTLGANKAFDSRSASLVEDILAEPPEDRKFDAIVDTVNGVKATPKLLDLLSGPRQFAELLTGTNIDPGLVPKDIKHVVVHTGLMEGKPYAPTVLHSLTNLVNDRKYVPPIRVEVVGQGISEVEKGLRKLMEGVSGTKYVVKM